MFEGQPREEETLMEKIMMTTTVTTTIMTTKTNMICSSSRYPRKVLYKYILGVDDIAWGGNCTYEVTSFQWYKR